MEIPRKKPGDVIRAEEFNELAGRRSPQSSMPAGITDGDILAVRKVGASSHDFEVEAAELLPPFSVFGISGTLAGTRPRPRPLVKAISTVSGGGASPLVLLTNKRSEIRNGDTGLAYVIGSDPVMLRIAAGESDNLIGSVSDGELTVRWKGEGPLMALSPSFDGPSGAGKVAWFVATVAVGGWLLRTTTVIPARLGSTMGTGSGIVCYRDGAEIIESSKSITVYNAQGGDPIPIGAYRQAKLWQGVPLIDVVECP